MNIDIVAVVLARGGSKRLPKKNLLPLCGKPLIDWTFEVATKSAVIDLVVLSTDDQDILCEADKTGVRTIKRPAALATDLATSFDALVHVLNRLKDDAIIPKRIMLLQPTSPLRQTEDIDNAVMKMDETGAHSVISVCEAEHSPLWCNTLDDDGSMDDFILNTVKNQRSQDLSTYYRLNGAVYLADVDKFLEHKGFMMDNSRAIVMPRERSIDIDCQLDLEIAELLMKKRIEQKSINN
mgnify:CR=1 FL=1